METPKPPQVSISGRILIEGQLPAWGASPENPLPPPSPPWWEALTAKATFVLALGTVALAIVSLAALLVTHADTRGLIKQTRIASKQQHDDAFAAIGKAEIANKISQNLWETTRTGQRPYVWLSNEKDSTSEANESKWLFWSPVPHTNGLGQVVWQVFYTNFGKTLALHTQITPEIDITGPFQKAGTVIRESSSRPMPPNSEVVNVALSAQVMTKDQFDQLISLSDVIMLRAKISYYDSYGSPYETDVCLSLLAGGGKKYCPGNEMK